MKSMPRQIAQAMMMTISANTTPSKFGLVPGSASPDVKE